MENCHSGNHRHSFLFTFSCWLLIQGSCKYSLGFIEEEQNLALERPTYFPVPWFPTSWYFAWQQTFISDPWERQLSHHHEGLNSSCYPWGRWLEFILAGLRAGAAGEQWGQAVNQELPSVHWRTQKMTILGTLEREVISCQITLTLWSESFIICYYFWEPTFLRKISTPHFSAFYIRLTQRPGGNSSVIIASSCFMEEPLICFLSLHISFFSA